MVYVVSLGSLNMIHLTAQNLTQKEIIQNVFSPMIGVICSPHADELCARNNLTFVELLQPFSKLTNDGKNSNDPNEISLSLTLSDSDKSCSWFFTAYIRDGNQVPTSVKGIRLNICDVNWRPPQTMLARKMLTDTVTATQCERTTTIRIDGKISRLCCHSIHSQSFV